MAIKYRNRTDADHIATMRRRNLLSAGGIIPVRKCTRCRQSKSLIGGTTKNKRFVCKGCCDATAV